MLCLKQLKIIVAVRRSKRVVLKVKIMGLVAKDDQIAPEMVEEDERLQPMSSFA